MELSVICEVFTVVNQKRVVKQTSYGPTKTIPKNIIPNKILISKNNRTTKRIQIIPQSQSKIQPTK